MLAEDAKQQQQQQQTHPALQPELVLMHHSQRSQIDPPTTTAAACIELSHELQYGQHPTGSASLPAIHATSSQQACPEQMTTPNQVQAPHKAHMGSAAAPPSSSRKRSAASMDPKTASDAYSPAPKQQKQEAGDHALSTTEALSTGPGCYDASQHDMLHQQSADAGQEGALDDSSLNDTVGAIVVDASGRVGAGVSSGGIAMKTPGRVGEAAMYACGCWAADADPALNRPGVACSVSGVGEVIMRACLAKECCQKMLNQSLSVDEACSQVMHASTMQEAAPNDCGVLALRLLIEPAPSPAAAQATVECAALHYSKSMGIAWSSPSSPIPQCQISRQQPSDATRQQMVCAGYFTTFTLPQHH